MILGDKPLISEVVLSQSRRGLELKGGRAVSCGHVAQEGRGSRHGRRQPGDGGVGSHTGEARKEREGRERGRLASGPAHGMGPTCQRRKEEGGENGKWARLQFK
jgi:hypothetical protein